MRDIDRNPFFVLGLPPTCTRMEMERQGQLLLSMLEVGFAEALTYSTPIGERERRPEDVREAMAALRDPDQRLRAELWALVPLTPSKDARSEAAPPPASAWTSAMQAMGWKR